MRTQDWTKFGFLSLAWGTSFLFIKLAVGELSPLLVGWLRLVLATLTLWLIVAFAGMRLRFSGRTWLALAVMALFNNSLAFVLIPWGEQYIDSGLAAILNSTVPLFTIFLAHFFLADERLNARRLGGLAVGFAGVVLLVAPQVSASSDHWLAAKSVQGSLAVVIASACYAIATVIGRRFVRDEPPMLTAATQVSFGVLWLLPVVLLTEDLATVTTISLTAWGSLLWLGAIGTGIAYLLYFSLLRDLGATQVVIVTYLLPIIGVALGMLLLDEALTLLMVAGLGLILVGLLAVNGVPWTRKRPTAIAAASDQP